jgi:hypothetical protein
LRDCGRVHDVGVTIRRTGVRRVGLAGALVTAVVGAGMVGVVGVIGVRPAAADVMPSGPVAMSWSTGSLTLTVNGTPTTVPGLSGTATGTVSPTGQLSFPQSGTTMSSFTGNVLVTVTIFPAATSAWTGTIDPANGTATVTGQMVTRAVAAPLINPPGCPVGPFTIQLSTQNPGGAAYDAATGAATLTDTTFVLPAIPAGAPECGGLEGAINAALGLPATGGLSLSVTFEPVLTGTGAPPPSTTIPTIPTTSPPPPVETVPVPPVTATAAQGELARTGSSAVPFALAAAVLLAAGAAALVPRHRARWRVPRD